MFILENGAAFNRTGQLSTDYKYTPSGTGRTFENAAFVYSNVDQNYYVIALNGSSLVRYNASGTQSSDIYYGNAGDLKSAQVYDVNVATRDATININNVIISFSFNGWNDLYSQLFTHYGNDATDYYKSVYSVLYVGTVYLYDEYEADDTETSPSYIGYDNIQSVTTDNVYYDSTNELWHEVDGYNPSGIKFRPFYWADGYRNYVAPLYVQIYASGHTSTQGQDANIIFKDYDRSGESISGQEYIQIAEYERYSGELVDLSLRFYDQSHSTFWHYYIDSSNNLHKVEYVEGSEVSDTNLGAYSDAKVLEEISNKYVTGTRGENLLLTSNLIKSNGWMSQALSDEEIEPPTPTPGNKTIYRRRNGVLKEIIPIEDERTDGGIVAYNEANDSLKTTDTAVLARLTVTDTASINHATIVTEEDIHSEADFIELRVGNPLPTPSTGSGIQINNYDGQGNDLNLITMSDGTLRLGEPGYEEPILTRDEAVNLRNGAPLVWDASGLKAVSSYTTDGNKVLKSVKNSTTGVVTYEWQTAGSSSVWRGTQAQLQTVLAITDPNDPQYLPDNAMIIVTDASEEYLNEEVQV